MVRKRVVIVLTVNDGVLFRTRNFVPDYRYTLNFVDAWSVDEIVLLDITRPGEGDRENFHQVVKTVASNCFVPLCVGGGVRGMDDFRTLLRMGADKVAVNTAAVDDPGFITEAARRYGSQCVVVSVDARLGPDGDYEAVAGFGTRPVGLGPDEWAAKAADRGAGEILLQSVERDGTLEGYDNRLVKLVSDAVDVPVLACSGAGSWSHFADGFEKGGADAACTTNIYHFTENSIKSAKQYLSDAGVNVRM